MRSHVHGVEVRTPWISWIIKIQMRLRVRYFMLTSSKVKILNSPHTNLNLLLKVIFNFKTNS